MPIQNTYSQNGQSIQTTDDTATTISQFATQAGKAYFIEAHVIGVQKDAGSDAATAGGYSRAASFRNAGGTLSQVGSTTSIATHEDTGGWDVAFAIDSQNVLLKVTGAASTVVDWRAELYITEIEGATVT